jgi:hypothetical protein
MPSQEDAGAGDHNVGAGQEVPPNDEQRIAAAFEAYIRDRKSSDGKNAKHNRKIRQWTRVGVIGGLFYAFLTLGQALAEAYACQTQCRRDCRSGEELLPHLEILPPHGLDCGLSGFREQNVVGKPPDRHCPWILW